MALISGLTVNDVACAPLNEAVEALRAP